MKDQFVPYELAVKLKELGFNEPCLALYKRDGSELATLDYIDYEGLKGSKNSELTGYWYNIAAPLWQQAFDWFREKYQFSIHIKYSSTASAFCWYIESFDEQIFNNSFQSNLNGYKTYREARQACLEQLIELVS